MATRDKNQVATAAAAQAAAATNGTPEPAPAPRAHKATYSTDKKKGGYLVRVEGPRASEFVGRTVPVTRRDNTESTEQLERLIWSGTDAESGKPVALYAFVQKPKAAVEVEF